LGGVNTQLSAICCQSIPNPQFQNFQFPDRNTGINSYPIFPRNIVSKDLNSEKLSSYL
jgi:hypothetical protein